MKSPYRTAASSILTKCFFIMDVSGFHRLLIVAFEMVRVEGRRTESRTDSVVHEYAVIGKNGSSNSLNKREP